MSKVIVLDDDPTGTQTVHSVSVLTVWDVDSLAAELMDDAPAAFILTNSRALPPDAANALAREIGTNLREAATRTGKVFGKDFVVVSRGDSTLRGHFPGEVEAFMAAVSSWQSAVGENAQHPTPDTIHNAVVATQPSSGTTADCRLLTAFSGVLIIPYFAAGGRVTIGDVHYIREGDKLTPVGETEFARDHAFGYKASNLREWVEEKTEGRIVAAAVVSVSLEDIREGGPERVAERLAEVRNGDGLQPSGGIKTPDG